MDKNYRRISFKKSSQYTKFGVTVNFPNNYKETANLEVEN